MVAQELDMKLLNKAKGHICEYNNKEEDNSPNTLSDKSL